ncbi:MAG: hypothetical protein WCP69_04615 [Bacteroidota bacterium]
MNFKILISMFFTVFSLLASSTGSAQNIFDTIHTEKYANFLFATHDYELAAEEYDRLLFMSNTKTDSLQWMLIRSTRLAGNIDKAIQRIHVYYPDTNFKTNYLSKEYLQLLFIKKENNLARNEIVRLRELDSTDRLFYTTTNEFLSENYSLASQLVNNSLQKNTALEPFKDVMLSINGQKHKSPVLAGTLSAIIPGLGQTYAGNWQDGVFASILTGSAIFQAYRGFNKYGIESVYGWVFSAMASAFYSANIYGAIKAANKHNILNHIKISIQVEALLFNYYN